MRQSWTPDRRLFIKGASRFIGATAAARGLLSLGPSMQGARSQPRAPTPEPLIQPPEMHSVNGVLDMTIAAAPGPVQLGDRAFTGLLYNGAYVPPTLRARLGDTLRISFRNNLNSELDRPGYLGLICAGAGTASNQGGGGGEGAGGSAGGGAGGAASSSSGAGGPAAMSPSGAGSGTANSGATASQWPAAPSANPKSTTGNANGTAPTQSGPNQGTVNGDRTGVVTSLGTNAAGTAGSSGTPC